MPSTKQNKSCHDERTKPGWLEAGTQGFRISIICEKNELHGKNIFVTPGENQQSAIRPLLCDGEHIHSLQTKLKQDCKLVKPDQTSTPVQPRSVKARHLVLNEQSPKPTSFLEPIPFVQEMKGERIQETNLGSHKNCIIDVDLHENYKSVISKYSNGSAKDPFDVILSPVCKVKQRKETNLGEIKSTLETSELKLNGEVKLTNSVKSPDEKSKKKIVLIEVEGSLNEMFSSSTNKNMHTESVNISGKNSLCKDGFLLNTLSNEKIKAIENTNPKIFNEEQKIDLNCQDDIRHQNEHSIKKSILDSTTPSFQMNPKCLNLSVSTNGEKQSIEIISEDKKKCISHSIQERTDMEMPGLFKKNKLAKKFVYPTNLGEGYEELNVSYTEIIGDEETWNMTEAPDTKDPTRNTPNITMTSEISTKALELESKGVIYSTPVNKTDDERCIDNAPVSKRTICNTHAGGDETLLDGDIPNGKRTSCNLPATLLNAKEEVHFLGIRQKNFLSVSNLVNSDISDINSSSSFEPLQHDGCEQMAKSSEIKKSPIDAKEVDLSKIKVHEHNPTEGLSTQGNKEQINHDVSISLNNQLVSDTFSDIDFSDTDLDTSLPLEECTAMDDNKRMKPDKDSDVFTKVTCRKGGFDRDYFNWSNSMKDPVFIGFITGNGKQVKVSDKALEKARKFVEEKTSEEHNLGLQQVLNGNPVIMDCSDIPQEKSKRNNLTSLHMATNLNVCTLSEVGSLNLCNSLPSDVGNKGKGTSKFGRNFHNKNNYNILQVNSNCTHEKTQETLDEEASRESIYAEMRNMFTNGDEMSKASGMQDSCYDHSRKTSVYSITETQNLKANNTGGRFKKLAKCEKAQVKASMVYESAHLLCKESNSLMCTGEAKLMQNKEMSSEHKSCAFQGFSTAAGSQIKTSKEALRKAQMFFEEEKLEETHMSIQIHKNETSKFHKYNSLSKDQAVRLRSGIPAELKTTIETQTLESQQCIPINTLKTTEYSSNDYNFSNELENDLEKLSKAGLPSTHTDSSICSSTCVLEDHQSGSLVASQLDTKNEANKVGISLHTLHDEPFSSRKNNSKDIHNAESKTFLEMDVGLKVKEKAFMNEASSLQAAYLKEATNSEDMKSLQQHNILKEIGTGFHTAKGKKLSVNKSSITQACLLWKETDGSEIKTLDQEVAQEQERTYLNVEISSKIVGKPDGMFLDPDFLCLPKKIMGSNPSSNITLSVRKAEEKEFAAFSNQETMSSIDREKISKFDKTNTNLQLRNADTFTDLNTDSYNANEKVHKMNLLIKPRKLFVDEMHFKSVMKCQSPLSVSSNDTDFISDGKTNIPISRVDNTKQVNVNNKSLQQTAQLSQQCIRSENCPSFGTKKDLSNTCKRQAAPVEPFLMTTDKNTGNTDKYVKVICGSPILGSQRNNKERDINSMYLLEATQSLKNDSVNTQEISDISDVTEAFLKDYIQDNEATKKISSQRKRPLNLKEDKEEHSLTSHKKMKRSMMYSQPENVQGCGARETVKIFTREKLKENQGVHPIPGHLYKLRTERKQDRIKSDSYGNLQDKKSLLNDADKKLDDAFDSQALPDKISLCSEKTVKWKNIRSVKNELLQTGNENNIRNLEADRQEQLAKEVESKLKLLSQYGPPAYSPGILSSASLQTRKPFRVPLRRPQSSTSKEESECH
ncbi:uncharacterized protein LOC123514045 isoform X2 [Portunus trituberculatus]|nr:uncharacterized protein LOC123514045 isoform X2 [Portunus trituberculatus]